MSDENKNKKLDSGEASKTPRAKVELSEAQYLAKQQADAQQAMKAVLRELSRNALATADPREWTKQYPWISSFVAMGAGFAAGFALTPQKGESFKAKFESIKEALKPSADVDPSDNAPRVKVDPPKGQPSMLTTLLQTAIRTFGPLVTGAITAATAAAANTPDAYEGNGHDANGNETA